MKLFAGVPQTDYQNVLRVLGAWLDARGWRDVRMWEHAEGIILQGHTDPVASLETVLLTDDVLRELLAEAYRQRRQVAPDWLRRT